jgi:iron complex transport system ATP-binding protein
LLQAADVVAGYPGRPPVLHHVGVEIPSGGLVGILGPNGSGKTTLLRALAGVIRPSHGHVRLDGRNLADVPKRLLAKRMAVVPQETHLAFDYSVLEVVLMGRHAHLSTLELEGPGDFAIARGAMAATGTLSLQNRPFDTLSGGEKQRAIVAAALAQISGAQADGILLLDEPTVALDLAYQLELAELLREWHRHASMTIVVSTHDLNFAANLCTSLVLLKDGRVLASGATEDVLTSEQIRRLYDVEADVSRHASTGRMVVVPLRRALTQPKS